MHKPSYIWKSPAERGVGLDSPLEADRRRRFRPGWVRDGRDEPVQRV